MTGAEFRACRAAAGLTVRSAAVALGVAPSTIQRWQMDGVSIPSNAAERIRELAGDTSLSMTAADRLGRLYAVLERVLKDEVPPSIPGLWKATPAIAVAQLIALARANELRRFKAHEDEVEALFNDLGGFPDFLSPADEGAFWLAYYKRRAEFRADQSYVKS